jgi:hypothetical protein
VNFVARASVPHPISKTTVGYTQVEVLFRYTIISYFNTPIFMGHGLLRHHS